MKRTKKGVSFFLIVQMLWLQSCYEPVEGCLDPRAKNFDVEADNPCASCCDFPSLLLDFRHKAIKNGQVKNVGYLDSIYYDQVGNPFRLRKILYYLSDFQLVAPDGTASSIEDVLTITFVDGQGTTKVLELRDDFSIVDPQKFNVHEIGAFQKTGRIDSIRFLVGVSDPAVQALPSAFSAGHPLAAQTPAMWNLAAGYTSALVNLNRDTSAQADTVLINLLPSDGLMRVSLAVDIELKQAYDLKVVLQVDYLRWFAGVDVKEDSPDVIRKKLITNLPQSFSLISISNE